MIYQLVCEHLGDVFLRNVECDCLLHSQETIDRLRSRTARVAQLRGSVVEGGLHHDGSLAGEGPDREEIEADYLQPVRGHTRTQLENLIQ